MKGIKKAAGAIAGIMAATVMTVPVLASGNIAVVTEDGTESGHSYTAYQLLSGTHLGDDTLWDIHFADDIPESLWDTLGADPDERAATDIAHWLSESVDADTDGSFAVKVARAVLADESIKADAAFKAGEEITLDDGYYLVTSDDAQPMLVLIGNDETLTINEKSSVPTMDKEIGEVSPEGEAAWGDAADTGLGKIVPYRITGTLPSNYDAYDEYEYDFHDTYDACLVVQPDSVKVSVIDADGNEVSDITEKADIEISETGLDVYFRNLKEAYEAYTEGDEIRVDYEVLITDEAKVGSDSNDNYAWIEYTRSPTCDSLGKSGPDRCRLYTWELDLNKLASDTKEALCGAEFTIRDEAGLYVNTDGTVSENVTETSTWKTDSEGHFAAVRVDSGTFTVTETKAPEGYQSVGTFTVTIDAQYSDENNVKLTASGAGSGVEITSVDAKCGITVTQVTDLPDELPPDTGDRTHVILYLTILLASCAGLAGVAAITVKKAKKTEK